MNNENFEFKVGDRVMIEGILRESPISGYPLFFSTYEKPKEGSIGFSITKDGRYRSDRDVIIKLIERPKPKLTFEFIRNNLVPMKSILFDDDEGYGRLYLGFNRDGVLITDDHHGSRCIYWDESDIQDWTYEEYNEN